LTAIDRQRIQVADRREIQVDLRLEAAFAVEQIERRGPVRLLSGRIVPLAPVA
jgi:hypothetical protein